MCFIDTNFTLSFTPDLYFYFFCLNLEEHLYDEIRLGNSVAVLPSVCDCACLYLSCVSIRASPLIISPNRTDWWPAEAGAPSDVSHCAL